MRKLLTTLLYIYVILTAYIVISFFVGITYQPIFTPLLSLLAFSFAIIHASQKMGWIKAALLLFLTIAVSLFFESLGVATGLVYGPYHYTDILGVKFLGLVPILIPIAWFMMTYPSYVIAERLVPVLRNIWVWRLLVVAIGGIVMTAWDLAMDPMMVAGGHWIWEEHGAYFGVPIQNYWGWWLTTFVTFMLFLIVGRVTPKKDSQSNGFDKLAILSYAITGLSSIIVDFQAGLAGPALVGIFAMSPWVILGWWSRSETKKQD